MDPPILNLGAGWR